MFIFIYFVLLLLILFCYYFVLQKTVLTRYLLSPYHYEKDVEPPLVDGATNTTVQIRLNLLCATPDGDFVTVESWPFLVSGVYVSSCCVGMTMVQ